MKRNDARTLHLIVASVWLDQATSALLPTIPVGVCAPTPFSGQSQERRVVAL